MLKPVFKVARLVCLAMGVFVIFVEFWSLHEADNVIVAYGRSSVEMTSVRGTLLSRYMYSSFRPNRQFDFQWYAFDRARDVDRYDYLRYRRSWLERRGFQLELYHSGASIAVPHWFAALILLLMGFSESIQRFLMKRLPSVPRSVRARLLRASRLFVIAMIAAIVATPIVVLCARFTFKEAWAALLNTPMLFGVFLVIPLAGIWLVRKPLRVQRDRLMVHRDRYLCTACGYNLTKNTTGICPECGATSMRLMKKVEGEK